MDQVQAIMVLARNIMGSLTSHPTTTTLSRPMNSLNTSTLHHMARVGRIYFKW
jgi:hypothetical protein